MRRLLSAFLSFVMVCSLFPAPALAEAVEEATDPIEGTANPIEEATDPIEGTTPGAELTSEEEPIAVEEESPEDVEPTEGVRRSVGGTRSDMTGTYTDSTTGIVYSLQWKTEGLAITNIALPETDANGVALEPGSIDVSIPKGEIVYDTSEGEGTGRGTITVIDSYGWDGNETARATVRNVFIPNTILSIPSPLFNARRPNPLPNLQHVEFEAAVEGDSEHTGITSLCTSFFFGCYMRSVTLPTKLELIGDYAFEGCPNLTSIDIPPSVQTIGFGAFKDAENIEQVTFHEGLKSIGGRAFDGDNGRDHKAKITQIAFPNSLETIGEKAFFQIPSLASVSFGTSLTESHLTSIGNSAFEGTALTEVCIPDAVTDIGIWAFAECRDKDISDGGHYTIQTIELGSSQEASQLQSIGERAFFRSQITTIALPNKLTYMGYDESFDRDNHPWTYEHGHCTKSAFYASTQLENIYWPTQPPVNGLGLTHVGGFDNCRKLSPSVVEELPSWITTIDCCGFFQSFTESGEETLIIPGSISTIKDMAFGGTHDSWSDTPQISRLVIEDGTSPLTIGHEVFAVRGVAAANGTVILPSRVVSLGADTFGYDSFYERNNRPTYYVYNKDILIAEGTNPFLGRPIVYYPDDASEDSDIMRLKSEHENPDDYTFIPFATHPERTITGAVPEGATVSLIVNGESSEAELLDGTTLNTTVADKSYVTAIVSLDGYADYTLQPNDDGMLATDWDFEVTTEDMTPLYTTGAVTVGVVKERATERESILAAIGCNIVLFDQEGRVAARGVTPTSRLYSATGLLPGSYTVVAFDENDYFKTISSVEDFSRLGVVEGSWATANVEVVAGQIADVTLNVPDLTIASEEETLESGSIVVEDSRIVPGCAFFARVSYKMKEGTSASEVQVNIPSGMVPTSAATLYKNYGIGGYDPYSHVLTLAGLAPADQQEATVYVGLKVEAPGIYGVSASVASGAVVAPLGSISIYAPALALETPQDDLSSPTFRAEVYAAPSSEVRFKIGSTAIVDEDGNAIVATTNKVGHATATLTIPEEELNSFANYTVTAYVVDVEDKVQSETTQVVRYRPENSADWKVREWELSFVYENNRIYLVRNGEEVPNAHYGVHFVSSPFDYSPTWPFTSVLDSKRGLGDTARLMLKMLNGDIRYEEMQLVKKEPLEDGAWRYTYVASVPFGDGIRTNELMIKDIPCRFEVIPSYVDEIDASLPSEPTQAEINMFKQMQVQQMNMYSTLFKRANNEVKASLQHTYTGIEYPEYDPQAYEEFVFVDKLQCEYYPWLVEVIKSYEDWVNDGNKPNEFESECYWRIKQEKEDIEEIEALSKRYFDVLKQLAGTKKPMYEYDSLQKYLEANYGYRVDMGLDPATLEASGYTLLYDGDLESVEGAVTYDHSTGQMDVPEWRAVRNNGSVFDYCDSNGTCLSIPLNRDYSDATVESSNVQLLSVLAKSEEQEEDSEEDHWWQWLTLPQWIDVVGQLNCALLARLENHYQFTDWFLRLGYERLPEARFNEGKVPPPGAVRGFFIKACQIGNALYYTWTVGSELYSIMDNGRTMDALGREYVINIQRQNQTAPNSRCLNALKEEQRALETYDRQLEENSRYSAVNVTVSTVIYGSSIGVGAFTGGLGVAAGLAIGGVWTLGYSYINGTNQVYTNAYKDDYEIKKHFREIQCGDVNDPKHKADVGIDPSGFVYEGVESNRVAGVTATIQYRNADGEWVVWDADNYDQVNPQTTDSIGEFAWDVPMGWWRVLFSHDDYDDTQTEAMEVPPERKGLAIPLVTKLAPGVESVTADDQIVEVVFRQYMNMDTAPVVTMGGITLAGGEWADPTPVNDTQGATSYARVWRVAVPAGTQMGSTLPVTVSDAVNYANKAMESAWSDDVKVAPRPAQIVLDYGDVVSQQTGTARDIRVLVLDAGGDPIVGARVVTTGNNPELASVSGADVVTDASGVTAAQIEALLPGTSQLTFAVAGTGLKRTVSLVTTLGANVSARPTATVAGTAVGEGVEPTSEYAVDPGATIALASPTEGAVVYYTTDGSDPRVAGDARRTYSDPIAIDSSQTVRAVSYVDGKDFSDELALKVRVSEDVGRATVSGLSAQSYTGKALTPRPTVKLGTTTLLANRDYTVAYADNVNAGTATVTITGKGSYRGTKKVTFKINPLAITSVDVGTSFYSYDGRAKRPVVTVYSGKAIVPSSAYSVAYANNVAPGTATVTVTGKGNYTGKMSASFSIALGEGHVFYRTHVQNDGWQDYVSDGAMSGTSGRSLRLEGINIKLGGMTVSGGIEYRTHVQNIGWQSYVANGKMSGTSGRSLRLEAIQIRLTGKVAELYDVWYRVHAQDYGWLGWACDDSPAGTAGLSKRLEGIEVLVLPKGSAAPGQPYGAFVSKTGASPEQSFTGHFISCRTHVQDIGWQSWVCDGQMSGTQGLAKRLEGIGIKLEDLPCSGDVAYRTHVQNIGWQDWVSNGKMSGTSGRSLRLEAIQIKLTGVVAERYDVWYRVHCQNFGWMGWASNGDMAGSAGYGYRLEGIQILLLPRHSAPPGSTAYAFRQR